MMNGKEILQGDFRSLTQNLYSYTQTDHYFANHHWLYGIFAYLLHLAVGWGGMVVFKVLLILLTFWILFKTAIQKANFWLVALCALPAFLVIAGRSALRPELFGYFFIAVYVYELLKTETKSGNRIYWLIPLQLLWANIHITWPIGPMIVVGFLLEKILLHPASSFRQKFTWRGIQSILHDTLVRKLALLTVLLVAVSFLNPLGINGVLYSLNKNIGSQADGPLVSMEVQPLSSQINGSPVSTYRPIYIMMGVLLLSFILGYKKFNLFYFLGSMATILMTLHVLRGSPFVGMFFLLAVPSNLTPVFTIIQQWVQHKLVQFKFDLELLVGWGAIIWLTSYLCFNLISSVMKSPNFGFGLVRNAEDSAKFFIDNNLTGPIFNDSDVGSYLIWYLYPKEKIFADNRFGDAYSNQFFRENYVEPLLDDIKWKAILEKYKFNTIFLYQYNGGYDIRNFIARRIADPEWVWVYGDRFNVILVRNIPENRQVIDKYAITVQNIKERFKPLIMSLVGDDQIAVGDLFALGGQPNWARGSYAVALSQHPTWGKIWWAMGEMELLRGPQNGGDPSLGALFIENAIRYGWVTPNAYSYLALAYYQMGFLDEAEKAVRNELKLNPKSEDGKRWLDVLTKARLEAKVREDIANQEKLRAEIETNAKAIDAAKEK